MKPTFLALLLSLTTYQAEAVTAPAHHATASASATAQPAKHRRVKHHRVKRHQRHQA